MQNGAVVREAIAHQRRVRDSALYKNTFEPTLFYFQGSSRSTILVPIERACEFRAIVNSSNSAVFCTVFDITVLQYAKNG